MVDELVAARCWPTIFEDDTGEKGIGHILHLRLWVRLHELIQLSALQGMQGPSHRRDESGISWQHCNPQSGPPAYTII